MPLSSNIQAPYETSGASPFSRPKRKILVAEDSPDSREMMQVLLESKGYDVISAGDGYRAVDVAKQHVPDLILIDLELPGLDGLSVARELRLHPELRLVPIIIISGHDPSRYREAALNAGCNEYLLKPIDFERLDQILNESVPTPIKRARSA